MSELDTIMTKQKQLKNKEKLVRDKIKKKVGADIVKSTKVTSLNEFHEKFIVLEKSQLTGESTFKNEHNFNIPFEDIKFLKSVSNAKKNGERLNFDEIISQLVNRVEKWEEIAPL
ncbi:hypothetical protein ACOJIU_17735 (plasmid) [Carnobacterium maltaromaticum]